MLSKSVALISKNNVMLYEFDKGFEKNFQNKKEYSDLLLLKV